MKKFKIIGFLVVVLFLNIFVYQNVLAGDACISDDTCNSATPYCVSNECAECRSNSDCPKDKPGCVNGACQEVSATSSGGSSGGSSDATITSSIAGDQRCWTKDTCIAYREKTYDFTPEEAAKGFYSAVEHSDAKDACGTMRGDQEMGFCSPDTVANTEVGFGTVKTFANFGIFIQYIYKYGFLVAGVLAVVVIIFGGIEWMTSAGSQEKIKAGQKRIFDAVIGLSILSLSYIILNFINPYIVNFRLPQIWIINSSLLGVEFCHDIPNYNTTETYKLAGSKADVLEVEKITSIYNSGLTLSYKKEDFTCGKQYAFSSAPNKTVVCRGSACSDNQVCLALPEKGYNCVNGVISGAIDPGAKFWDTIRGENWEDDVLNDIELHVVCADGKTIQIDGGDKVYNDGSDRQAAYVVSADIGVIQEAINDCGGEKKILGFVLYPDFNENWDITDEPHWLGKQPNQNSDKSSAIDLGDRWTDFFDKLKSGQSVYYKGKDYPAKDFLIPTEYFIGDKSGQYKLNIVAADIKDID